MICYLTKSISEKTSFVLTLCIYTLQNAKGIILQFMKYSYPCNKSPMEMRQVIEHSLESLLSKEIYTAGCPRKSITTVK